MKTVVVQGLGFVGLAMSVAVASAQDKKNRNIYRVIGLDLANELGKQKVKDINSGNFPINSTDKLLEESFNNCIKKGNLTASTNPEVISKADYIIVDINLDVDTSQERGSVDFTGFKSAINTIAKYIKQDALLIIETTVPPGTTEKIVYPIIKNEFIKKYSKQVAPMVAHSYERVMPGPNYFNSIKNFWRVFAGIDKSSSIKCRSFLETIINTNKYELRDVKNTTASETAKIMENSFRALNIAFIDEWSKFAEIAKIDLFDVISAIRVRPTHKNIMNPGLGVGGYCLTKDPLMGMISLDQIYNKKSDFPLSKLSIDINKNMPNNTLKIIEENLQNVGDKILVLGITYLEDVGDLRFSASEQLINLLLERNFHVDCYDPMINYSTCKGVNIFNNLPESYDYSAIILAVKHSKFKELNFQNWLENFSGILIDSNNILSKIDLNNLKNSGIKVKAIGRGSL